jgi:hypothetical protein
MLNQDGCVYNQSSLDKSEKEIAIFCAGVVLILGCS